jgi:murein DD-endopeptidase MepM/ murein hydrolase activator NlpD
VDHWLSGYDYTPEANHPAVDFGGAMGNAIYAADNGVVVYAGWNDWGYGNVTVIDHGNGYQTLYAHQSQIRVGCGQSVFKGDLIGNMGSTGNSSGPHLHFEMWDNGAHVSPHSYLPIESSP